MLNRLDLGRTQPRKCSRYTPHRKSTIASPLAGSACNCTRSSKSAIAWGGIELYRTHTHTRDAQTTFKSLGWYKTCHSLVDPQIQNKHGHEQGLQENAKKYTCGTSGTRPTGSTESGEPLNLPHQMTIKCHTSKLLHTYTLHASLGRRNLRDDVYRVSRCLKIQFLTA